MPFAKKFRAMMDFPFAGDALDGFVIESVDVRDEHGGAEGYVYGVRIVLRGLGGKQGVKHALRSLFSSHVTTFSGYGNPYQLWFRKPEIESLGDKRYAVTVKGSGMRIHLEPELERFLAYLAGEGCLAADLDPAIRERLVESYLDGYRAEIRRKVGRYRSRLAKANKEAHHDPS
jgi:hypothetical protein